MYIISFLWYNRYKLRLYLAMISTGTLVLERTINEWYRRTVGSSHGGGVNLLVGVGDHASAHRHRL